MSPALPDLPGRARRRAAVRLRGAVRRSRRALGLANANPLIDRWALRESEAPRLLAGADTDMERAYYGHAGRPIHKWTHYLQAYDRHLTPFRGTRVGMLEIGVFEGGSLELWRDYLGPDARIMGIDINPLCADRVSPPNLVRIGSQADPDFLRRCVDELGAPLDIVLDDGSHVGEHQWASFRTLFPLLADGGLYVIEDLHTSYWTDSGARRVRDPGSGIGLVKSLIDDMHAWYHEAGDPSGASRWIPAIHVYDSMVFIEKTARSTPEHITVGSEE